MSDSVSHYLVIQDSDCEKYNSLTTEEIWYYYDSDHQIVEVWDNLERYKFCGESGWEPISELELRTHLTR